MAMLHTVNKSPFERNTLDSCLRLAKQGSAVLLIEDGIFAAMQGTAVADKLREAMNGVRFYVLGPDVAARGIRQEQLLSDIQVVDYEGFVELAAGHDNIQAWL